MVNPPTLSSPSYATYVHERDAILNSLQRRADRLTVKLNEMEGVDCQPIEGALYAFPSIAIPAKVGDASSLYWF
jgi:alanine transaminase